MSAVAGIVTTAILLVRFRHFAAEPGAGKKDEREGEDRGSCGEGHVEVAVGVVDVMMAGQVPKQQRQRPR